MMKQKKKIVNKQNRTDLAVLAVQKYSKMTKRRMLGYKMVFLKPGYIFQNVYINKTKITQKSKIFKQTYLLNIFQFDLPSTMPICVLVTCIQSHAKR